MKTVLFSLASVFTFQVVIAQEPILISPAVGSEIDLAEKKQYRLFPYYSSQFFVSSSVYMMPDSTMQLKTKMIHDSIVTKPFSKQELAFLRNMVGSSETKKTTVVVSGSEDINNKGVYFSLGGGFHLPTAGNLGLSERTSTSNTISSTYTNKQRPLSGTLGKGFNFGFTIGYKANKNLAIDLNTSYLKGSKLTGSYSSTGNNYTSKGSDELQYSGLRFIPSLKLILPFQKIELYIRTGIVMSIKNKMNYANENSNSDPWSSSVRKELTVYSGGTAIGYSGGLGLHYEISKTVGLFGEANFIALTWAPKHSEIIESTYNGVDQLPSMYIYQKEIDYFRSIRKP